MAEPTYQVRNIIPDCDDPQCPAVRYSHGHYPPRYVKAEMIEKIRAEYERLEMSNRHKLNGRLKR